VNHSVFNKLLLPLLMMMIYLKLGVYGVSEDLLKR